MFSLSSSEPPPFGRLIERHDRIRGAAQAPDPLAGNKEWFHFCVLDDHVEMLLNFSVMRDLRPATRGGHVGRVTWLARDARGWAGGVEETPRSRLDFVPGSLAARFGDSSFGFANDRFEVDLASEGVSGHLTFTPQSMVVVRRPFVRNAMNWAVTPRLAATGEIVVEGRRHEVRGVPAYHDHNWGSWIWGQDCVWQWAFASSEAPASGADQWSIVIVRLSDRRHLRELGREVLLWKNGSLVRVFRDDDLTFSSHGRLATQGIKKFPPIMALVSPGQNTDVPGRIEISCGRESDELDVVLEVSDLAQIVVPNESDLGVTVINECVGRITARGTVSGEPVVINGRAFFEYLTVDSE